MRKILLVAPLALLLAGCPTDAIMGGGSATSAAPAAGAATPMNIAGFLGRIEAARGTALTVAEKGQVTAAAQGTRGMIDNAQQKFLGTVGQFAGMDAATVGLLFPQVAQPLSQADVLAKLEQKAGKKLGGVEAQAAKAAVTLRNNSLSSLKSGLAGKVGGIVGLDGPTVEALLPMLGL
ncbi:MAG: hypothetical protein Q8J78_15300 [Moraxellaceae bacterium]|nr:hypothetical protein [Moraxellaceae bacterium]